MPLFSTEEQPLLTGTEEEIEQFIDADRCIVIDWKQTEDEALWDVQRWLPEGTLTFAIAPENSEGDITITVRFGSREENFTLPPRPQNCFRVLLRVGRMLPPEYEIKLFRATEGDDTPVFLLRSAPWWEAFQREYPERYVSIFSDLEKLTGLWELEASPKPLSPPRAENPLRPWWRLW